VVHDGGAFGGQQSHQYVGPDIGYPDEEQGIQVAGSAASQIWCKPLGMNFNMKAVALFNNSTNAASMTLNCEIRSTDASSARFQ